MVRGKAQGRDQHAENPNQEFMTLLLNVQRQVNEQAALLQQQARMIRRLQQQQGRLSLERKGLEEEGPNTDSSNRGDGSYDHGNNGAGNLSIGVPRGNLQPQPVQREYLFERFCNMKPPSFEGSTDFLDAEEWLATLEMIFDFMELNDEEKIVCAACVLEKKARYWWEIVKTRRNVREMTWTDFLDEFNKKFFTPTALGVHQTEFLNFKQGDNDKGKGPQSNQQQRQNMYYNKRKCSKQSARDTRQRTSKNNSITYPTCGKCEKNHPGECRQGTTACYKCGNDGHYAKGCTTKATGDDGHNEKLKSQLRSLETMAVGPNVEPDKKNAPEPNVRSYVHTKDDVEAGSSKVATG